MSYDKSEYRKNRTILYSDPMGFVSVAKSTNETWSYERYFPNATKFKRKCIARVIDNDLLLNINANLIHVREAEKFYKSQGIEWTYTNEPEGIPDPDKKTSPIDSAKEIMGDIEELDEY